MAGTKEYATSAETRGRILDVCRRLFYEKGYTQTTYAEICRQANVHPGTITYHFGSKSGLGNALYRQIVEDYNEAVEAMFPEEDELQQKLIGNGLHHKLMFKDEAFRRFSSEFSTGDLSKGALTQYIDSASKAYRLTERYVGEERAKFLFVAFKGMDAYLERYVCENINELTYEQVFIYISEMYHPYLDRTELYARLTNAIRVIDTLDVEFKEFRVVISKI